MTVEHLLAQVNNSQLRCVAGFEGLTRNIDSFTILDTPEISSWLKGGEFVASVGYVTKINPDMNRTLIQDLYEKGCAGLGVKMNSYYDEIPAEYIEYGNRLGFPIIQMPYNMKFSDLAFVIHKNMFLSSLDRTEKSYDLFRKIFGLIMNKSSIDHILYEIGQSLQTPCLLLSKDIQVISFEIPSQFSQIPNLGQELVENIHEKEKGIKIFFETYPNFSYTTSIQVTGHLFSSTIYPVHNDKMILGYLVIFSLMPENPKNDTLLVETCLSLLSLYFIRKNLFPMLKNDSSSFFENVIQQQEESSDTLIYYCDLYEFDYLKKRVCINIVLPVNNLWSYEHNKTIRNLFDVSLREVCSKAGLYSYSLWVGHHFIIYLLFQKEAPNEWIHTEIKAFLENIEKLFHSLITPVGIGISSIAQEISHIQRAYKEAVEVVPIGRKVEPKEKFHYYESLKIYYLLSSKLSSDEIKAYTLCLEPLIRFDSESNTDYVFTLEHYIKNKMNISQTAKELFIHRNSLAYRLDRIKEMLQIDLDDPSTIFNLELAFIALKLLR